MQQSILTINAGSSSVKFALFELAEHINEKAAISGQIDGIGTAHVRLVAKDNTGTRIVDQALPAGADHATSFDQLLHWFSSSAKGGKIVAVGHRVVHGGDRYSHPVVLSAADLEQLAQYSRLAPLHQPHNLNGIYAIEKVLADVPQIACFDTAFHRTQSEIAQMYGLPRKYSEEGAKRYGFHGISYEYIASVLPQHCKKADGRVIVCHLGNGASMTAMVGRKCVATTLGFSTLDGLIMGTRCGPIDPGLILHIMESKGFGVKEMTHLLYKESGLLGVSGISQDMRTLVASDKPEAKEAIELFCYRIVRELGSLAAAAGGLDAVVFTGGIGEHNPGLRSNICKQASWQGITLDEAANKSGEHRISAADSAVDVFVIPTNEEWMIARHTQALLGL
ncbi:MAG: acetate/propionate family kinase [Propionivibrio sp.]|jgi:acetate kinase|uniref:acetate/propionate family kinase n=1 Tax=Propionivibrio sp. TaxID=2212460 RepID=UPI001B3CF2FE|nr:acetate/propionate family kinase [Propionivibrio sp.]MBP7203169.1 acetate/propionate family kinase [Propionivibrio sp.]